MMNKELEKAKKEARSLSALDSAPSISKLIGIEQGIKQKYYYYKDGSGYVYETDSVRQMRAERNRGKEAERRRKWTERQAALEKERMTYK